MKKSFFIFLILFVMRGCICQPPVLPRIKNACWFASSLQLMLNMPEVLECWVRDKEQFKSIGWFYNFLLLAEKKVKLGVVSMKEYKVLYENIAESFGDVGEPSSLISKFNKDKRIFLVDDFYSKNVGGLEGYYIFAPGDIMIDDFFGMSDATAFVVNSVVLPKKFLSDFKKECFYCYTAKNEFPMYILSSFFSSHLQLKSLSGFDFVSKLRLWPQNVLKGCDGRRINVYCSVQGKATSIIVGNGEEISHDYDLVGLLLQAGSPHLPGGHFVSVIRDQEDGFWYYADDLYNKVISSIGVNISNVYDLFSWARKVGGWNFDSALYGLYRLKREPVEELYRDLKVLSYTLTNKVKA